MSGKADIIMGSKSDLDAVKPCVETLKEFGVEVGVYVASAHRSPDIAIQKARSARERGTEVIIGVAGKAAHLAGVLAANTTLPVIGLPTATSMMGGLDSLLSTVQMPSGIPVATVAVGGGANAALLAVRILSVKYPDLAEKLAAYAKSMRDKTEADSKSVQLFFHLTEN